LGISSLFPYPPEALPKLSPDESLHITTAMFLNLNLEAIVWIVRLIAGRSPNPD
jgi:hypothetical protein